MGYRNVPPDWVEFSDAFIEDVKLGVHAGWQHLPGDGFSEAVVFTPEGGGEPQAWQIRRNRILGSPLPVIADASADL
jgi:hypothetical protein